MHFASGHHQLFGPEIVIGHVPVSVRRGVQASGKLFGPEIGCLHVEKHCGYGTCQYNQKRH
jgi:hypothetical protein